MPVRASSAPSNIWPTASHSRSRNKSRLWTRMASKGVACVISVAGVSCRVLFFMLRGPPRNTNFLHPLEDRHEGEAHGQRLGAGLQADGAAPGVVPGHRGDGLHVDDGGA